MYLSESQFLSHKYLFLRNNRVKCIVDVSGTKMRGAEGLRGVRSV